LPGLRAVTMRAGVADFSTSWGEVAAGLRSSPARPPSPPPTPRAPRPSCALAGVCSGRRCGRCASWGVCGKAVGAHSDNPASRRPSTLMA
jgi:hypothetical protein